MKAVYLFVMMVAYSIMHAQAGEFGSGSNGLIYSDKAVNELKHIVDSLNLKFKVCENKSYYANLQGKAGYIKIDSINVIAAKKDIEKGVPFDQIAKKYTNAVTYKNLLGVRHIYKDERNREVLYFEFLSLSENSVRELDFEQNDFLKFKNVRKGWFFKYHPATSYSSEYVEGCYFDKELTSAPLKDKYTKLVQYSDCLIDTTQQVYLISANAGYTGYSNFKEYTKRNKKIQNLQEYINSKLKRPLFPASIMADTTAVDTAYFESKEMLDYSAEMELWDKTRTKKIDSLMQYDKKFKKMFLDTYQAALKGEVNTDDDFEEYVSRYVSKEQALYFKRNRRVVGGCSMDDSPRRHAMNIAELAGETAKWEIFLRSHLDIMNDRFDRVSDGSYAQQGRKTYIKELEVLDIDVSNLLLGISLHVENPSQNHYYGSINRIGRSLSEANNREVIEKEIINSISDKSLDDYNRLLMYYLFLNYNYNLYNKEIQQANKVRLEQAVATLPDYLSSGYKN